ncbi:hypothetical protein [Halomonas lysinitropha]|uniref:Uncharacterized protein n=1 Tax=Halomonas lysinitropha TaxID=2607506 RepID=A0A5K1IAU5_9GAMM|nr:hypothetical protein [Halomonas lysinitropha]VVZ97360.1 hypothetical protein HALO32_03478 [Halomonas lysinitropha]
MTTRHQFFRVQLLTTGTTTDITTTDWEEALIKTGRRDAAVLMRCTLPELPGEAGPELPEEAVVAIHLPLGHEAGPCLHVAETAEQALADARQCDEVTP